MLCLQKTIVTAKVRKKSELHKIFAKNNRLSLRNKTFFCHFVRNLAIIGAETEISSDLRKPPKQICAKFPNNAFFICIYQKKVVPLQKF